jgi:hypothetical protein
VRNLQVMQMRPGQSAEKLKLLAELERSARAAPDQGAGVREKSESLTRALCG